MAKIPQPDITVISGRVTCGFDYFIDIIDASLKPYRYIKFNDKISL